MTSAERLRAALERGAVIIVVSMMCGAAALAAYGTTVAPTYEATARVVLPDTSLEALATGSGAVGDPARRAATGAAMATSTSFQQAVAAKVYGSPDRWTDVRRKLTTSADDSDTTLGFTVRSDSEDDAVRLANGAAEEYIPFRRQLLDAPLRAAIADLELRIASERTVPQDLEAALARLRVLSAVSNAEPSVASPAAGADESSRNLFRDALLGAAAGLVVGLLVVAVREAADLRVWSRFEAEELAGAPVLAHLPAMAEPRTVVAGTPQTTGDVAVGRALAERGWHAVALIGPSSKRARLGVAARIAGGLASGGRNVLVGDAGGEADALDELLRDATGDVNGGGPHRTIQVIPSSDVDRLGWAGVLTSMPRSYDYAVVSAPWPVEALPADLVTVLDGAVIVLDESTTRASVRLAVASLDRLSVPLLGIVMVA